MSFTDKKMYIVTLLMFGVSVRPLVNKLLNIITESQIVFICIIKSTVNIVLLLIKLTKVLKY